MNESLTAKIDEMVKIANDSHSIFCKLCILVDFPSNEETEPAVDAHLGEMKEIKKQRRFLQPSTSASFAAMSS